MVEKLLESSDFCNFFANLIVLFIKGEILLFYLFVKEENDL